MKKLDEKTIVNELHGESAFFRPSPPLLREIPSPHVTGKHKKKEATQQGVNNPAIRLRDEAADKNASQPVDQSTARSVDQSTRELKRHPFDMSPVLSRPKSFYITEKQDEDLDILVKKLADKVTRLLKYPLTDRYYLAIGLG